MKNIAKISFSFLALAAVLVLSGCDILKSNDPGYKINLEIWGPIDDSAVIRDLTEEYRRNNPYVGTINYRKMVYDNYKTDLIDALASGQGPDIFLINNNWLPYFKNKIEPAPDYLVRETDVRDSFVDVVGWEMVADGRVYSLPMSVDSLALFCNKDMFNAAGITSFPSTWEELVEISQKLTHIDNNGNILQSGAALGTAYNINRSTDVLALLMIQNGALMTNAEKTRATFSDPIYQSGGSNKAGESALDFYVRFADINSPYYTWNSRMHYSVDAFSEESVAMMVNYSWQTGAILLKNAKLNFTIVPVPQFSGQKPANLAYYMGFAVNKNKIPPQAGSDDQAVPANYNQLRIHESWQLIKYLTMKNNGILTLTNGNTGNSKSFPVKIDPAEKYLTDTGRPAARRDLVEKQKNVPLLSAFASGNLIAQSWYQTDPESTARILEEMIDEINRGSNSIYKALETAEQRVTQIMIGK